MYSVKIRTTLRSSEKILRLMGVFVLRVVVEIAGVRIRRLNALNSVSRARNGTKGVEACFRVVKRRGSSVSSVSTRRGKTK